MLQRSYRAHLRRRVAAAVCVQAAARGWQARMRYRRMHAAALVLQVRIARATKRRHYV